MKNRALCLFSHPLYNVHVHAKLNTRCQITVKHKINCQIKIIRICQASGAMPLDPILGALPPTPPGALPLDPAEGLQSADSLHPPPLPSSYSLWIHLCLGAHLVIHSDIPVIVNCLFSKWLLVVPLCMLSVAAEYKMHTERLVTVSVPSGQIN